LHDARIIPIAYHDGRVDVRVRTREVWTLHPGVSLGRSGGANSKGFLLEELNLFGYGKQFGVNYKSNVDRSTTVIDYQDPQLFGTRWTLSAQAGNNSDGRRDFFAVERPFYSLDSRWSAGVRLLNDSRTDSVYDLGAVRDQYDGKQRFASLNAGLSKGLQDHFVARWTAGITYDDRQYAARLSATGQGFAPESRKLVYPWIGYELVENQYRKLENLNQIGRTEDIALGWRTNAFAGFASPGFGADRKALVWSGSFRHIAAPSESEIVELNAGISGRAESGQSKNTLTNVAGRYYWRQSPRQLFFMNLQADIGSRLDGDQRLTLGGDNGLRGYPLRYQTGSGRWVATVEQRIFSDWYPFRLARIGGAVFYDMGRTWGDNPLGSRSVGVLRDAGFGLRIAHSRSGFGNVTHIDVAFPFGTSKDISKAQLLIETKSSF
jgi:outer membrane protein assembly factor BamA